MIFLIIIFQPWAKIFIIHLEIKNKTRNRHQEGTEMTMLNYRENKQFIKDPESLESETR